MRWIALFLFFVSTAGLAGQAQATVAPKGQAESLVLDWAKRWSNKNFVGYAELYSPAYRSSEYKDLNSWLRVRERRLATPKQIEVRVYDLRVLRAAATQLDLEFVQYYSSDRLRVYSLKRQTWHLVEGRWRIRLEEAVDLADSQAVVRQALQKPVLATAAAVPKTSSWPLSETTSQDPEARAPALPLQSPSSSVASTEPPNVFISDFQFEGQLRVFSQEALGRVLSQYRGHRLNQAQMQAAVGDLTRHYRDQGYVAAVALLPEQDFQKGILRILIFEGDPDPRLPVRVEAAEGLRLDTGWISKVMQASLGDGPVEQSRLERGLLLLSDIPGVMTTVSLEPGEAPGSTRAVVDAQEGRPYEIQLGGSNHGAKATGENLLSFDGRLNNPLGRGEQAGLLLKPSEKKDQETALFQGSVPLGNHGLRLGLTAGYFAYSIDGEDQPNFFRGKARETSFQLNWPVTRSRIKNRRATLEWSQKQMRDTRGEEIVRKELHLMSAGWTHDSRDLASGLTHWWGSTLYWGDLNLGRSPDNFVNDQETLKTDGRFMRLTGQAGLAMRLDDAWLLSTTLSGQLASKNLNSSEKFGLGGPGAVRAYPVGEASGDMGLRASAELRRSLLSLPTLGDLSVSAFYDWGRVRKQVNPLPDSEAVNRFYLKGWGLGLTAALERSHEFRLLWARKIGTNPGQIFAADGISLVDSDGTNNRERFWASFTLWF